jgi:hypothetical protein
MQDIGQATKYRDLVVLLLVLDEVEMRVRKLSKQFPELEAIAKSVYQAADLCDMALTVESMELTPK